ncbi:MAG: hypothetical protein WC781_05400 [Candidatus Pacearchaeota archaeon]|jgi:hypothetical protein
MKQKSVWILFFIIVLLSSISYADCKENPSDPACQNKDPNQDRVYGQCVGFFDVDCAGEKVTFSIARYFAELNYDIFVYTYGNPADDKGYGIAESQFQFDFMEDVNNAVKKMIVAVLFMWGMIIVLMGIFGMTSPQKWVEAKENMINWFKTCGLIIAAAFIYVVFVEFVNEFNSLFVSSIDLTSMFDIIIRSTGENTGQILLQLVICVLLGLYLFFIFMSKMVVAFSLPIFTLILGLWYIPSARFISRSLLKLLIFYMVIPTLLITPVVVASLFSFIVPAGMLKTIILICGLLAGILFEAVCGVLVFCMVFLELIQPILKPILAGMRVMSGDISALKDLAIEEKENRK